MLVGGLRCLWSLFTFYAMKNLWPILRLVWLATLAGSACVTSAQGSVGAATIASVKPAVVRIVTNSHRVGSGMVLDQEGYILTAAHVVRETDDLTVFLTDGREYRAQLIGVDDERDIALLQIPGTSFRPVRLGTAARVAEGQEVVALGYALDLAGGLTVTRGIVSAFRRGPIGDLLYIQTDAAINPGNSGGPLINSNGEVVGILTSFIRQSGSTVVQGLNFAISIDSVKPLLKPLKTGLYLPTATPIPTPTVTPSPTATPTPRPTVTPSSALPRLPTLPHRFGGAVTIDGGFAPDGIRVSAVVDGKEVASTTTRGSLYRLDVFQPEGVPFTGRSVTLTVTFKGVTVAQTAEWEPGGGTILDLAVSGVGSTGTP